MSTLDIPITTIKMSSIYFSENDYINFEFDLLTVNGKKVGTYKISRRSQLPEETKQLMSEFIDHLENVASQLATQELKLIEAKTDEEENEEL